MTGIAASVFLIAQLGSVGYDPYRFVRIGEDFADPARVPPGASVGPSGGYDGQFYYRIALDPFLTERTAHGITFDNGPFRHQRILYPLLAWALSGGAAPLVPFLLIAVNLAGLVVIGWLAGHLARSAGRHALWGLAISLYPGYLITLARDLAEIVASCFFLGSLLLLRSGRPAPAAGTLGVGVFARESVLGLPLAVLAAAAIERVRKRAFDPRRVAFVLPIAIAFVWQMVLARAWDESAASSTAAAFADPVTGGFALPGTGFELAFIWRSVRFRADWVFFFVFLASASAIAGAALRRSRAPLHEKLAWAGYLLGASSLGTHIWHMPNGFLRALTELGGLNALVVFGAGPAPVAVLTVLTVAAWLVMAVLHAEV